MRGELRALRRALGDLLDRPGTASDDPAIRGLRVAGLDAGQADSLVATWRAERESDRDRTLEAVLAERIEARLAVPRPEDARRPRVLVGAPGVGKTTSLAKLAGRSEEGERDVAIVSLDRARLGAAEALRRFAGSIEVPFREAGDLTELPALARDFRGRAVLVDTAGRGPGAGEAVARPETMPSGLRERLRIELVVDATSRIDVLRRQLARFAPLAPERVIVTRTDECDSAVDVVNLLLEPACPPLCWLGTGQRVPVDLELADARALARSVVERAA